jgi:hypothetical protein
LFTNLDLNTSSVDWKLLAQIDSDKEHKCIMNDKCKKVIQYIHTNKDKLIVDEQIMTNREYIDDLRESYNILSSATANKGAVKFSKQLIQHLFYLTRFSYGIKNQHYSYCKRGNTDKDSMLAPRFMKLYKSIMEMASKYDNKIEFSSGVLIELDGQIKTLYGIPDHYEIDENNNRIVVEIKTTRDNKTEHLIQLLLYSIIMKLNCTHKFTMPQLDDNDNDNSVDLKNHTVKIINLLSASITTYEFNIDPYLIINYVTNNTKSD